MRTLLIFLLLAPLGASWPASPDIPIYVVRHGWHTGIALPRAHLTPGALPEAEHFPRAAYLEVGWGDRDFYRAPGFNAWYGFKALFWPTASVLHLAALERSPAEQFGADDVVELRVTHAGLQALLGYVSDSFVRPGRQAAAPLGPGLYGTSAFYPSRETFHLFRTCNVWIARALRIAGLPIEAALSAESILDQARRLSKPTPSPTANAARPAETPR